jgi:hypothetical protein
VRERDPDAELLDELRRILERADPVPPEVREFGRAALGWRRLDADLAELLEDSALDSVTHALTRSAGESRWLSFRSVDLAVEVELVCDGPRVRLLGQLEPAPAGAAIEAQDAEAVAVGSVNADELGRFRLELVAEGRIRLRILREGAAPVETSWFCP